MQNGAEHLARVLAGFLKMNVFKSVTCITEISLSKVCILAASFSPLSSFSFQTFFEVLPHIATSYCRCASNLYCKGFNEHRTCQMTRGIFSPALKYSHCFNSKVRNVVSWHLFLCSLGWYILQRHDNLQKLS